MSDVSVTADAARFRAGEGNAADRGPEAASALGAYAESLFRGRRVAVLGDATAPLSEQLLARGARLVHVYDPDAGRIALAAAQRASDQGARGLRPTLAQYSDDLGVRDGAFDVILVPDLSSFDDPVEVVRRARRLVSASGVVVVASPNPEARRFLLPPSGAAHRALGYYELFDAMSLQFPEVRMLGQAPFVGYSIVDFAESEPEVSVDTSLLEEPEAPEWYIVVASDRRIELDPYALVELPVADIARLGVGTPSITPAAEPVTQPRIVTGPSESEVALTEARTRISVLLTENETLREQVKDRTRADRAAEQASFRAAELEREMEALQRRSSELTREIDAAHARGQALEGTTRRLEAELDAERRARETFAAGAAHAKTIEVSLGDARRRIAELEAQLASLEPPTLRSKELQQQRLLALEAQRDEVAGREQRAVARVRELEARVRELEARGRDLEARGRELDTQLAGMTPPAQVTQLRKERDEARARAEASDMQLRKERDEALARAEVSEGQAASLFATLESEREKATEDRTRVAPLEHEIHALEDTLRDRGREVTRLQRELRETEQVGRELLFELEQARGSNGVNGAGGGGATPSGEGRGSGSFDLADRAARAEADLMAATWKISRLEREIARQGSPERTDPGVTVRELEVALTAAQREIALLRGAAGYDESFLQGRVAPGDPVGGGTASLEDAVLLGQLERERLGPTGRP
ncbi:MAG: hypothetical protein HOW73_34370 [Polyangiaceae bacterium]|nr:hypothetical protein [Polyangiaceae bacterium]